MCFCGLRGFRTNSDNSPTQYYITGI